MTNVLDPRGNLLPVPYRSTYKRIRAIVFIFLHNCIWMILGGTEGLVLRKVLPIWPVNALRNLY